MFDITTETGEIRFSQNVIYTIVDRAVDSCEGKAELNNYKGKAKKRGKDKSKEKGKTPVDKSNIEVDYKDGKLRITVYITVKFGNSIKEITESIMDKIYEDMQQILGRTPFTTKIIVTGIVSKDTARRHLEFIR